MFNVLQFYKKKCVRMSSLHNIFCNWYKRKNKDKTPISRPTFTKFLNGDPLDCPVYIVEFIISHAKMTYEQITDKVEL